MTTDYVVIIVKYLQIYNILIIRHTWDKQGLSKCRCLSHLRYNSAMCENFPKVHWGAPHVLLALLLGAGDSGGLDSMGESLTCWLECSVEVSVKTLSDAWSD